VVITSNEADTCRKCVVPGLIKAGWDEPPHSIAEQRAFTDGRIVVTGNRIKRRKRKRADYLLRYTRDFPIAVVEAKAEYKLPGDGMQQAKLYAEILGLKFAYSTNGVGIVEYDGTTCLEQEIDTFPSPEDLWTRLRSSDGLHDEVIVDRLLTPSDLSTSTPRYYQEIAINRFRPLRRVVFPAAAGLGGGRPRP
jgi:type I restriction enzyme R subunit